MSGLTIDDPITLSKALTGTSVIPGDVLLLRGGIYAGGFTSSMNGTLERPVTIRPYPGEHAVIDGSLNVNGKYTNWINLEMMYSGWIGRDEVPNGTLPPYGVSMSGVGNKAIGCIIHDTAGNGSWQSNAGGGYFDCLIYNCGWLSPDRGHGHGIYAQNEFPTQYHHNNIIWGQYGWGLHAYTEGGLLYYFDLRQNISFHNGGRCAVLGGSGGQRMHNSVIDQNCFWEGDGLLKGDDIILTNNYFPAGFTIDATSARLIQSGNTFTKPASGTNVFVFPRQDGGAHIAIYNWDGADSVDVSVPTRGAYRLHNAQDYFNDITEGVTDGVLTVDMRAASHTVAARIGSRAVATTFPAFGCFVLEAA